MRLRSLNLKNGSMKAAVAGLCLGLLVLLFVFVKWTFGHAIAVKAEQPEVAELGVQFAPGDAHAHYEYGLLLEKTFLPGDQERALREFERAVSLVPDNYLFLLALGRAHEQAGNAESAEAAFRKAVELAPNYARPRWVLGNALLRQGRQDEAFSEIRFAVAADRTLAGPAAAAAWQVHGGDLGQIEGAIGGSPEIAASLAVLLAGEKRFDEAVEVWRAIPDEQKRQMQEPAGQLAAKFLEAGKFRSAIRARQATGVVSASGAQIGSISNGGFEAEISATGSDPFSWLISDGAVPRIGPSNTTKHDGNYSLLISYGQGGKGERRVAQRVGVESPAGYELRFFYRSELKGSGKFRCEIAAAGSGEKLAESILQPAAEWAEVRLGFNVPAGVEGIEIRVGAENCQTENCLSGNIWFDDFALVRN